MGCENELMDLGNHGMAGGSLSLQSLCQKQTLSMKRCLPAKVFWLVTSIPNYIHLDSRNHNIEPQIELESIDAQPRAMGSNQAKPMQWYHQWFMEIASTVSSIFNHNHSFDAFNKKLTAQLWFPADDRCSVAQCQPSREERRQNHHV